MSYPCFKKFSWIAVAFYVGSSLALGRSPAPVTAQQNAPHTLKIPDGTLNAISTPLPGPPAGGKVADFGADVHQNGNQIGNPQSGGVSKPLN